MIINELFHNYNKTKQGLPTTDTPMTWDLHSLKQLSNDGGSGWKVRFMGASKWDFWCTSLLFSQQNQKLVNAAERGDCESVMKALNEGAEVDYQPGYGSVCWGIKLKCCIALMNKPL